MTMIVPASSASVENAFLTYTCDTCEEGWHMRLPGLKRKMSGHVTRARMMSSQCLSLLKPAHVPSPVNAERSVQ